jgi:hypothetical protein
LWLSRDDVTYFGWPTFREEVLSFTQRLQGHGVQFPLQGGLSRVHHWASGWLSEALTGLQAMRDPGAPPPPPPEVAQDDFDRPDGGLGASWTSDPSWGAGIRIDGGQAGAEPYGGGAHFWSGTVVGADQPAQARLTGAIGD